MLGAEAWSQHQGTCLTQICALAAVVSEDPAQWRNVIAEVVVPPTQFIIAKDPVGNIFQKVCPYPPGHIPAPEAAPSPSCERHVEPVAPEPVKSSLRLHSSEDVSPMLPSARNALCMSAGLMPRKYTLCSTLVCQFVHCSRNIEEEDSVNVPMPTP